MRGAAFRIGGVLSSLLLIAHCAARSPGATPSQLADLARADALVREGCYRCLQDAFGIYETLATRPARRPWDQALRGAFDVTLLLAVREKELGLSPDASLTRARALLAELSRSGSAQTPGHENRSTLLDAAEAVVGNVAGLDSDERQRRADGLQQIDAATDTIAPLQRSLRQSAATDLTAVYLALAIDCEHPGRRAPVEPATALAQAGRPPLLQYRHAICLHDRPTALTRLREADPRWTDAYFFEGKYEMGTPARAPEPARAAALLRSASQAFPASIAIHVMLARAHEMNGDFAAALASFDAILASKPGHADARLGRVRNLSYLGHADEAIAAATALIDLGIWHVGDAYYWRAWNAYQARRPEPAWTDVQHAMRLLSNTAVYALAGSIAYARADLDIAVRHFDRAFDIDPTNCLAVWSAGLVAIDQVAWQPAADRFSKATNCFAIAAKTVRTELAQLEQSALEPALKASRVSSARKRIESAEELGAQSAFNAAQSFVEIGEKRLALTYLEQAVSHPATHDKAQALKPRIASMR